MAKVYAAISAVQRDLSATGVSKDRRNTQGGGYNFRGIDDVYNALSPLMAKHGLCVLPRITSREITERASKAGGVLFYVVVTGEFDFVSAEDGSIHTVRTYGEAMDSGDKATNKAMSAAYKYAAFMAFAIPTEASDDADAHTPEVAPARRAVPAKKSEPVDAPALDRLPALKLAKLLMDASNDEGVAYGTEHIAGVVDDSADGKALRMGLDALADEASARVVGIAWEPKGNAKWPKAAAWLRAEVAKAGVQ